MNKYLKALRKNDYKFFLIANISLYICLVFCFIFRLKMKSWTMGVKEYFFLGILLILIDLIIKVLNFNFKKHIFLKLVLNFIGEFGGFIGYLILFFVCVSLL